MTETYPNRTDQNVLLGMYQVLNERYASNTTLQWQIPLYVIPAQVGLLAGIIASRHALAATLGGAALLVGVIGSIVMRRIELTDRQKLDEFESELLHGDSPLRLLHDAQFSERLREQALRVAASRYRKTELRLMLLFPPSVTVIALMIALGALASAVGVSR
jgi:hypothetical protein